MNGDQVREYKLECLLDEHRSLSSFIEKEILMTTVTKIVCIVAWLAGVAAAGISGSSGLVMPAVAIAVIALWSVDVLYAYIGDIYKRRRLRVRAWLEELPRASDAEVASWKTPANPFDGVSRSEKMAALSGTLTSPMVTPVYAALLLLVLALAAAG